MTGMMCGDMKQRVFIIVWTHEYISWWQRCSQLFWMYIDDVINNQWFRGFIITWWQNQNGMKLLLWNYMYKINGKEWGATKRVWFRFVIVLSFFLFFFVGGLSLPAFIPRTCTRFGSSGGVNVGAGWWSSERFYIANVGFQQHRSTLSRAQNIMHMF